MQDHGFKTSCRKAVLCLSPFKVFLKKMHSFIFGCFRVFIVYGLSLVAVVWASLGYDMQASRCSGFSR